MADKRTRAQKLAAMASQSVSPHEAEVARQKLAKLAATSPNPMAAPPRPRPQATFVRWGADGKMHVEFRDAPRYKTAAEAQAAYEAAVDRLNQMFNAKYAEASRTFTGTFTGSTSFRVETDAEREERKRAYDNLAKSRKSTEWGQPRPGVKYPRGSRG